MTLSVGYKLIVGFVALIIGIVLISVIASQTIAVTDKTIVVDESVDAASAILSANDINVSVNLSLANIPAGWKIADCPLTSITISNNTGTALTITTDYLVYPVQGVYSLVNSSGVLADLAVSTADTNNTLVDYTYCQDDYLNSAFGRSSQNLVPGFFALALLAVAIGLFYSVGRDTGII